MFQPLHCFTPKSYTPAVAEEFEGKGSSFFATCSLVDKEVFDFVPFADLGFHRHLVPDEGRNLPSYASFELFSEEEVSLAELKSLFSPLLTTTGRFHSLMSPLTLVLAPPPFSRPPVYLLIGPGF